MSLKKPSLSLRQYAVFSLIFNLAYAFYNGTLGLLNGSVWFGATCFYYILLAVMRFVSLVGTRRGDTSREKGLAITAGTILSALSLLLVLILYISLTHPVAVRYGTIPMITVATYTFTKIALAVVRAVKNRHETSPVMSALRAIGYAEIAVSVLTMQRSMLVSFGEMPSGEATVLNSFSGTAVCIFVLYLGIITIRKGNNYGKVENCKSE